MSLEKKHSVMGLFKKHHHSAEHTLAPNDLQSTHATDVAVQPDAGSEFTEKDVNFSSMFMPFIRNYVSNLSAGKSPNKLPYPPCFYYPASSLQHQMNLQMYYIDLLTKANTLATPLERFLCVLKYSLSTCSLTKFPYKPIIAFMGETAQTYTTHTDGTTTDTTYYIGEQVDRDPVTSAFYIANPTRGVMHEGSVVMLPKFKQAHIQVNFAGQRRTVLTHPQGLYNETYVADVPDLVIRLLRMHTELGGSINVSCETKGFAASVQFKDKPIFGGVRNAIVGRVTQHGRELYHLDGTWDDVIYLTDSITKQKYEFFNRKTHLKQKVESYPLEQLPPTSGEKVWGQLIEALRREDFEQAKVIKAQLDVQGHELLARYEQQGGFVPSFFLKNTATGTYQLKDTALIGGAGGKPTM